MTDTSPRRGPVLIELDTPAADARPGPASEARDDTLNPADAPPIDAADPALPRPRTMEMVTRLVGRPPSKLTRFFINSGVALFTFLLSIAALNFINDLLNRYPVLGWIGVALFALFTLAALGMAWREYRAWARFAKIDAIQRRAGLALADDSMDKARAVADDLLALYRDRPELEWNRKRLADNRGDARAKITDLELLDAGGRSLLRRTGLFGYVLAGAHRRWALTVEESVGLRASEIQARVNGENVRQKLRPRTDAR